MGCSNSRPTWCRASDAVLRDVPEVAKGVDDCLVQAQSKEALVPKLRKFFEAAKQGNMKFRRKKIQLGPSVEFGGYQISQATSGPPIQQALPRKVAVIQDYPEPRDEQEMKRFLGMCAQFSKFFPDLSHMTKPLREQLKKLVDNQFGAMEKKHF